MSRNENLFYLFGSEEVAFKFFTPNLGILTIFRMRGVLVFVRMRVLGHLGGVGIFIIALPAQ